jgi:hypothetical protein
METAAVTALRTSAWLANRLDGLDWVHFCLTSVQFDSVGLFWWRGKYGAYCREFDMYNRITEDMLMYGKRYWR